MGKAGRDWGKPRRLIEGPVKVEMDRGTLGGSEEGWEGLGKAARSWGRLGGTWEGLEGLEKAEDV